MEAANILSADVLDIIFDDRNKEYGAYDLRKHYQQRLTKALVVMALVVILLLITYMLVAAIKPASKGIVEVKEVTLETVTDKKKLDPPPVIPPPQQVEPPKERMIKDMVPLIVKDNMPVDEMPEQKDIDNAKIGNANTDGIDDKDIVGPPVDDRTAVVEVPKKQDDEGSIFTAVEIESQYPGGISAWSAFLYRHLVYPQQAIDDEKQGTVYVQFIVDTEGNVSDVTAISGPEELRAAAVAVIKKSGRWTAAIQNNRKVKSYKKQPITFKLATD